MPPRYVMRAALCVCLRDLLSCRHDAIYAAIFSAIRCRRCRQPFARIRRWLMSCHATPLPCARLPRRARARAFCLLIAAHYFDYAFDAIIRYFSPPAVAAISHAGFTSLRCHCRFDSHFIFAIFL
jgi:hypothetical protein